MSTKKKVIDDYEDEEFGDDVEDTMFQDPNAGRGHRNSSTVGKQNNATLSSKGSLPNINVQSKGNLSGLSGSES